MSETKSIEIDLIITDPEDVIDLVTSDDEAPIEQTQSLPATDHAGAPAAAAGAAHAPLSVAVKPEQGVSAPSPALERGNGQQRLETKLAPQRAARSQGLQNWGVDDEDEKDDGMKDEGGSSYHASGEETGESEDEAVQSRGGLKGQRPAEQVSRGSKAPRILCQIVHGASLEGVQPPRAAVPPFRVTIKAHHTDSMMYFTRPFLADFLKHAYGLPCPLNQPIKTYFWAENSKGERVTVQDSIYNTNKQTGGRTTTRGYKFLGEHLGVYNASQSSVLEFGALGSTPPPPGQPGYMRIYHLSVKKVEGPNGIADASAAPPPAKKFKPSPAAPTPPPAVPRTAVKQERPARPALIQSSAPPSVAPSAGLLHSAAPLQAVNRTQVLEAAQLVPHQPVQAASALEHAYAVPISSIVLEFCAEGFKGHEQIASGFSNNPVPRPPSLKLLSHKTLAEAKTNSRELWSGSGIYVAQGIDGLLAAATPKWCDAPVRPLSMALLGDPLLRRVRISDTLASVLQGKPPFNLWVGPVGDGTSASQVVALELIPAGSWVLQVPGEYVFGEAAVQAAGHPKARFIGNGGGGSGGGCIVPLGAAVTADQKQMCSTCKMGRHDRDESPFWRRLGGKALKTALDFSGTVTAFIQGPAADANLEAVEIDLPIGPTGTFLVACRDILPGERLMAALH